MVGYDQVRLEERLKEIGEDFTTGRIIEFVRKKSTELEQLLFEGLLTPFFYKCLHEDLKNRNTGRITDRDYEDHKQKFLKLTQFNKQKYHQRRDQRKAAGEQTYLFSLLQGSPVQSMTIVTKLSEKELKDKKSIAKSRLAAGSSDSGCQLPESSEPQTYLDIAESATMSDTLKREELTKLLRKLDPDSDKELLNCFKKEGAWRGRGTAGYFEQATNWQYVIAQIRRLIKSKGGKTDGALGVQRKAEVIKQENTERQTAEKIKRDLKQLENLKRDNKVESEEKYFAEMEKFASAKDRSEKASIIARVHSFEHAFNVAKKCGTGENNRERLFLLIQKVLRSHAASLEDEHKEKLSSILGQVGFYDLAQMLSKGLKSQAKISSTFSGPGCCSIRYQLEVVPMHLARPQGSPDVRVQFSPDEWQRRLLDIVDSENSALVVAPTASGKTFISYYVMEQCLRINDTDVVVYIAPTKALVNQVSAEIQARFSKKYSGNGKLVGVFTRDFRDDHFLDAQILVTVPACLGILFLTGSNVEWTLNVRHIIFDEVHCIGESGGEIWEQLLLIMEPKKGFLALSATLGNAQHFYKWLQKIEKGRGREVYEVVHGERWNDLFPWMWAPHKSTLTPVHPCWVLTRLKAMKEVINAKTFPQDLKLLPEHCVMLYDALLPFMEEEIRQKMDPKSFFTGDDRLWNVGMRQASEWAEDLKLALFKLSPAEQQTVLDSLSGETQACFSQSDEQLSGKGQTGFVLQEIVPLVKELKRQDMLPAICFMLSRKGCERLALTLTRNFARTESDKRKGDSHFISKRRKLLEKLRDLNEQLQKCKQVDFIDTDTGEVTSDRADLIEAISTRNRELRRMDQPDPEFCTANISQVLQCC